MKEQISELRFNLKRKEALEELGLSDDPSDDFFRDLISNGKRRFMEGPPLALLEAASRDNGWRLLTDASDDGEAGPDAESKKVAIAAVVVPDGQVIVTGPPPAIVTYEALGVTDVLFRFADVQLNTSQSAEVGRRTKQAYEAKHGKVPAKSQTRVNGHLVDACVYRRDDWHLIHESFAAYNDDRERAGHPRIKPTHPH